MHEISPAQSRLKPLRVTVDCDARDATELADVSTALHQTSKRRIFLSGLRALATLFRARRAGYRLQLVGPAGDAQPREFDALETVAPVTKPRMLSVSNVQPATIVALQRVSEERHDPQLVYLVSAVARAAYREGHQAVVDAATIIELIIRAYGSDSPVLLETTRDLVVQVATPLTRFDELVAQPAACAFDLSCAEQRFLSDQCRAHNAGTRRKGPKIV